MGLLSPEKEAPSALAGVWLFRTGEKSAIIVCPAKSKISILLPDLSPTGSTAVQTTLSPYLLCIAEALSNRLH